VKCFLRGRFLAKIQAWVSEKGRHLSSVPDMLAEVGVGVYSELTDSTIIFTSEIIQKREQYQHSLLIKCVPAVSITLIVFL